MKWMWSYFPNALLKAIICFSAREGEAFGKAGTATQSKVISLSSSSFLDGDGDGDGKSLFVCLSVPVTMREISHYMMIQQDDTTL